MNLSFEVTYAHEENKFSYAVVRLFDRNKPDEILDIPLRFEPDKDAVVESETHKDQWVIGSVNLASPKGHTAGIRVYSLEPVKSYRDLEEEEIFQVISHLSPSEEEEYKKWLEIPKVIPTYITDILEGGVSVELSFRITTAFEDELAAFTSVKLFPRETPDVIVNTSVSFEPGIGTIVESRSHKDRWIISYAAPIEAEEEIDMQGIRIYSLKPLESYRDVETEEIFDVTYS